MLGTALSVKLKLSGHDEGKVQLTKRLCMQITTATTTTTAPTTTTVTTATTTKAKS